MVRQLIKISIMVIMTSITKAEGFRLVVRFRYSELIKFVSIKL